MVPPPLAHMKAATPKPSGVLLFASPRLRGEAFAVRGILHLQRQASSGTINVMWPARRNGDLDDHPISPLHLLRPPGETCALWFVGAGALSQSPNSEQKTWTARGCPRISGIKPGQDQLVLALAGGPLAAIDLGLADLAGLDQRVHAGLGQVMPVPVHARSET